MYDPESGKLFWRRRADVRPDRNSKYAGKEAGDIGGKGYRRVTISGRKYRAHRIAWALCNGDWPEGDLDHVDGDRSNNRIANLRLATDAQNRWNSGAHADNSSRFKGVSWHARSRRWQARILVDGKNISLGYHINPVAAALAYANAAVVLHEDYCSPEVAALITAESAARDEFSMRMSTPTGLIF